MYSPEYIKNLQNYYSFLTQNRQRQKLVRIKNVIRITEKVMENSSEDNSRLNKMKNRKTFYKIQTAGYLKEIIEIIQSPKTSHSPTPSDEILLSLEQKFSYGNIQTFALRQNALKMQFLDVKKWNRCSVNVFSDTKQMQIC